MKNTKNRASQVAQWVKNLPAMQETQDMWIQSLGWENPLEKKTATHSSILAWRILWTLAYQASLSMRFFIHGILQTRILERPAMPSSRGYS